MTNNNAALANDTALPNTPEQPRPVTSYQNSEVHGMALSCDRVHEGRLEHIEALRTQQKDYVETLPKTPEAGCKAVRKAFGDWEDMDAPMAVAKANFIILREVLCHCDVDGYPDLIEALASLAERGIDAVAEVHQTMKLADDSVTNALSVLSGMDT